MKRILLLTLACLLLGGCSSKGYRQIREIESFEIVQTVGVDYEDGMYTVTAATGTGPEGQVSVLTSESVTLARAIQQMQNYSTKKYIFFGHAANYLVGEAAAENDLSACLEYVERGFNMRLDTNIFIVKGGKAGDAITKASEGGESVDDHLQALEKDVQILSENHIFDCGDIAEEIAADGGAVVTAISLWNNENVPVGETKKGIQVVGYAVIVGGRLTGYADVETSRGITLLMNHFVTDMEEIPDGMGGYAAVELVSGKAKYDAEFGGSGIEKIKIDVKLRGNIAEMESPVDIYDEQVIWELERVLAKKELERIVNALELSRRLDADILELGREVNMKHPVKFSRAREGEWIEQLAGTEIEVSVKVSVDRTYELGISPAEKEVRESEGRENNVQAVCGGGGGVHIFADIPPAAEKRT
ncbi:MAG: Ger(x)C family spore germination C-terminal domain-containing protein [Clostridiales bacterium]|nr:Ger(x)C family spore germination C-terminal domain-containing protein [Clostridiales bacterium]